MRVTPFVPASTAAHVSWVPIPSADTSPMPVTTTRLFTIPPGPLSRSTSYALLFFGFRVRLDVVDAFLDAGDLLGVLVRNLDPELLLERHHELHRVERVGAEVVDERGIGRHFLFIDAKLLHDDALHLVCDCHFASCGLHVHAAVDGKDLTCNIRRLIRG